MRIVKKVREDVYSTYTVEVNERFKQKLINDFNSILENKEDEINELTDEQIRLIIENLRTDDPLLSKEVEHNLYVRTTEEKVGYLLNSLIDGILWDERFAHYEVKESTVGEDWNEIDSY